MPEHHRFPQNEWYEHDVTKNNNGVRDHHLTAFAKKHPEISFQRARAYHMNDNAYVEQKNRRIVRGL